MKRICFAAAVLRSRSIAEPSRSRDLLNHNLLASKQSTSTTIREIIPKIFVSALCPLLVIVDSDRHVIACKRKWSITDIKIENLPICNGISSVISPGNIGCLCSVEHRDIEVRR